VSGIIPEFIDILWNFNTSYILEDNLLKKFKKQNKSIVFYGDDTWLKLFNPSEYFLRYEGTTSFIASDYDEVSG
jgi:ethanolamine phosphate transferase 2 subunit G